MDFSSLFKKLSSFSKVSDLLPYQSFEDPLFFNEEGLGFVLEVPPLVGASEEMQKEVSGLFQQGLPEGSSLQVMLLADPHIGPILDAYAASRAGPILKTLAEKRADYLTSFAFISPLRPYTLRTFRVILSFSMASQTVKARQEALELLRQTQTTLEMLGLPVKVWGPEDLISMLSSLLSLDAERTHPKSFRWNKLDLIKDQVVSHPLHVEEDCLNLGKTQVKTYTVRGFPEVWSLHAMGELLGDEERDQAQIPCPFILHYGVHVPKQGGPKSKVLAKATYVERQAYSPFGKYLPAIQREAEELAFVREQMGRGERIVQTQMSVILLAPESEILEAEQILTNLFASKEWKLESNTFLHLPSFLTTLPMMWGEGAVTSLLHLQKLKTTLSTESANLLPLQGEWKGTETPGMILAGRRGELMTWHPFDNKAGNYNVSVVGRSGSGKSVFMQELMTSTLGLGGRVFVLDVGRSFEKTCFLLEGQFIEFTSKTPLCLNPFSSLPTHDVTAAEDALSMLKTILSLMAAPTGGVGDMESALLEQALLETWRVHGRNSTITEVATWLKSHADKKAQDLGTMLFPYTAEGAYGRFFNGQSTINLENPLVVIELEELKERKDLQAVVVQMMIVNITNRMFLGDRKTPFMIVFDEAWDMLRGKQGGVFIETLARRLRKYRGSLVVGTQSINDFFVSPGAEAAFDNSDWMCLLSQKPESIEQLKKTSRISLMPQMERHLKSVKTRQGAYAEVMIYGSMGYAIGRLLLDPYSGLLYSTKAEDYAAVEALKAQGMTVAEALEAVLKERKR